VAEEATGNEANAPSGLSRMLPSDGHGTAQESESRGEVDVGGVPDLRSSPRTGLDAPTAPIAPTPAAAPNPFGRRRVIGEALIMLGLVLLVPAAHDVARILRAPYWLDESWVALLSRIPLSDLPERTLTSPLGWSVLLRLVPGGGEQHHRLLPLAFVGAAALAAYALGRLLAWRRWHQAVLAGTAAGVLVVLLPGQQQRHDLKHYTADGFAAVAVLALAAWAESSPSRRRLAAVGTASVASMLISHPVAFVGAAVMGAFVMMSVWRRHWARLLDTLLAGVATAAGMAAVYLLVTRRTRTPAVEAYWRDSYPPLDQGVSGILGFLQDQLADIGQPLGTYWPVMVALALLGVAVAADRGRPATALAAGLLPAILLMAGMLRLYPPAEARTSHFLFVVIAAFAGLGLMGLASIATRLFAPLRRTGALAPSAVVLAGLLGYLSVNADMLRVPSPMRGDVRSVVRYLEAHRGPDDVVVVNVGGSYGFGYYWRLDEPALLPNDPDTGGWSVSYPDNSRIIMAPSSTAGIVEALARAQRLATSGGRTGRVWVVRSHRNETDQERWTTALAGRGRDIDVGGLEPVLVIGPA
jgi:hypothetical protein